jgi:ribosomal-protein-alanine N-acetyltransferase
MVIEFGFSTLGLNRIAARFMQGNNASLRVMEKLGMTFEGYHRDAIYAKGEYKTIGYCAITRQDYLKD